MKFRLSLSVPHPFRDINNLIFSIMKYSNKVSKFLIYHILIEHQNYLLLLYLGEPRTGIQKVPTPWKCPRCGSRHGFVRRGWRSKPRTLKTSIGIIEFPLRNISCKKCGKTFSPFPEFWGLEPWQRISKELSEKAIFLATQFSYARSSNTLKELLNNSLAPITIHRMVQKTSGNIDCKNNDIIDPNVLMFDDTKVPAGDKEYGADLLLGIAIESNYRKHNRNHLKKSIISFNIDQGWRDVKLELKNKFKPDTVITDGDIKVKKFIEDVFPNSKIQQCIWHLFKTSDHYLWMDGLTVPVRRPLLKELSKLVENQDLNGIKVFVEQLQINGLENTANFINRGLKDLFTYLEEDIPFKATSPIEREMREINRRSDVGARWTVVGLSNLLNLRLAYEKNRKTWNNYWYDYSYEKRDNLSIVKI
ncbi:MAG: ISH6 family transposase [Halanaerobiales bacterium]